MDILIAIGFIGGTLIVFFGLIFYILRINNQKIFKQVSILSSNFRLQGLAALPKTWALSPYMPEMFGEYDGRKLRLYFYTTGSGKSTTYWTSLEMEVENREDQTIKIYKENFFSKIGKAIGGQDIQIGDGKFDSELILRASDEQFLKNLLTPEIREQFLRIWVERKPAGTVSLAGNTLQYIETGLVNNTARRERIEMAIILLQALSRNISAGLGEKHQGFFG